jgi:dual specificity tyrosine-phosphorylation-regulated kinase 2/3/4
MCGSTDTQATSMLTQGSKDSVRFPMTPEEASRYLQPYLWEIERKEIFEQDVIYFFPISERKKERNAIEKPPSGGSAYGEINEETNNGFDNDVQEYIVRYNEHIGYRFEVIKKLGKGSFGVVLRAFDHKLKEYVALKVLKNKKRLYKQGLVESKLIETLNKNDPEDKKNIIRRYE